MNILSKTLSLSLLWTMFSTFLACAQTDTIMINNQKTACSVKEVTPDAVKYTFPGEDVINTVYKNTVQLIIYKSGRRQTFAESTSYKPVSGVMDFDKVTITSVESEVKGLYKMIDVSSKAKGTTVYSSQERVKERAYRKLKIQAAMFGANIIYLFNQRTEGNKYGGYFSSSSTAETNLTGIAYSNVLVDFEGFKRVINSRTSFTATEKFELGASDSDVAREKISEPFNISGVSNANGITIIEAVLKGEKDNTSFQLVSYDTNGFRVAYKHKGTAYQIGVTL